MMSTAGVCPGPDCGRPLHAKGLCQGHYRQMMDGKPLTRLREWKHRGGTCEAEGCDEPTDYGARYCTTHSGRYYRSGHPLARRTDICPGCQKRRKLLKHLHCGECRRKYGSLVNKHDSGRSTYTDEEVRAAYPTVKAAVNHDVGRPEYEVYRLSHPELGLPSASTLYNRLRSWPSGRAAQRNFEREIREADCLDALAVVIDEVGRAVSGAEYERLRGPEMPCSATIAQRFAPKGWTKAHARLGIKALTHGDAAKIRYGLM